MPEHLELSFELGSLEPDAVEATCFETGALAVTLSDAADHPLFEPRPGEQPLWPSTRVQVLYAADQRPEVLVVRLAAALGLATAALAARSVADRAWEREWLRDFHAMRFGTRLWICPHHEQVTQADAAVVQLDPGLAFGTGTHPSTAQCLSWLDRRAGELGATGFGRLRVLDYGCGSGILALAALRLGARSACAFDIDPQALQATAQNAADNGLSRRLTICANEAELPGDCDLLLANILAPVLQPLAPRFAALLAPTRQLLLAGVLVEQGDWMAAAFAKWFDMQAVARRDGWLALAGTRLAGDDH